MVNKVKNAITLALHTEFTNAKIYTEDVPQGLTPPCFVVTGVRAVRSKETYVTYKNNMLFAIQYFSNADAYRNDINDVISRLQDCLEVLNVVYEPAQQGGTDKVKKTRTTCVDTEVADGLLTYTIRVEDIYFKKITGDNMADIEMSFGVEE